MVEKTIRFSYIFIFSLTIFAACFYLQKIGALRDLPRLVLWLVAFVYIYNYLFKKDEGFSDLSAVVYPALVFNLATIFLHYLVSFEFDMPKGFMRVSYLFGNFADFTTMADTYVRGTFDWISTGHFPFAYAIGKAFAQATGWTEAHVPSSRGMRAGYCVFALLCMGAILPLLHDVKNSLGNRNKFLLLLAFLATSYPIIVMLERGNLAIVTFAGLSLFCFFFVRNKLWICAVLIGLLASLKTLNLLLFVFLLSRFSWKYVLIGIATFVAVSVLSLFYLFGLDVSRWMLFKQAFLAPLNSPVIFSDATKLFLTSGFESLRTLFSTLVSGQQTEVTTQSAIFNKILLAIGASIAVYFYCVARKSTAWYLEFVFLLVLPMLFHSSSGDYNTSLLVPFWLILIVNLDSRETALLAKLMAVCFLLLSGLSISEISCCGDNLGRYVNLSPKGAIMPIALFSSLLMIIKIRINPNLLGKI